jgi:hypothetical protein
VKVGAGGGGTIGGSGTTNYVPKFTAGTTIGNSQIFDDGTNVGIGTTSPGYKLDVNVTDAGVGSKTIIASFGRIGASASATAREAGIVFRDADNPTLTGGITGVRENSSGNFLSGLNFYVQSNVSTAATSFSNLTEAMRITSGANVGIGYTAPASKLAVSGTTLINTNTDNGVDKLQVSGGAIASTLKVNTSGQTTTISNYYNGGVGKNLWIGGGGASSTSASERNVSIGVDALLANTSGYFNVGLGSESLRLCTSGSNNMAIGFQALYALTTGTRNTAIGNGALGSSNAPTNTVAIGSDAFVRQTSGSNNIAIGDKAGMFISGGGDLTSCDQSIYIGQDTRASANGNTNEMVFGHNAIGQGSNTVTLGNSSITKTFLRGNTMVNTTTDNGVDELQVQGSISGIGFKQGYVTKTGAYTATNDDYVIDCTSGTFTVTLPASSGRTGRILIIKNSGAGTITVDGNGAETIDGAATYSLAVQYATIQIISDGTNWKIIAKF